MGTGKGVQPSGGYSQGLGMGPTHPSGNVSRQGSMSHSANSIMRSSSNERIAPPSPLPPPTAVPPSAIKPKAEAYNARKIPMGVIDPTEAGETPRTVTCMRCQERLPLHRVPAHGAECKGNNLVNSGVSGLREFPTTSAPRVPGSMPGPSPNTTTSSYTSSSSFKLLTSRAQPGLSEAEIQKEELGLSRSHVPRTFASLIRNCTSPERRGDSCELSSRLSSRLPPKPLFPSTSTKNTMGLGDIPQQGGFDTSRPNIAGIKLPLSPPRPQDVSLWTTGHVTSWLRETMRPPLADVISRFHEGGIDGVDLLELTDRRAPNTAQILGQNIDIPTPKEQVVLVIHSTVVVTFTSNAIAIVFHVIPYNVRCREPSSVRLRSLCPTRRMLDTGTCPFELSKFDDLMLPFRLSRELLHPTEGLGITNADVRRQILEAVDNLVE